jgi:hypothetical protein
MPGSDRDDRGVVVALTARLREARGEVAELRRSSPPRTANCSRCAANCPQRRQLPAAVLQAADKQP